MQGKKYYQATLFTNFQLSDRVPYDVFKQLLKQCIDEGMLTGKKQAIDSVYAKASAAMDSVKTF